MSSATRVLRRLLVLTFALLALIAGAIWIRLWRATPQVSGSLLLPGISRPLEILRDADGVPHIRAATEADAMFGVGVVHAQDRLWQMEFQRRLGRGRLAEILGPDALRTDRFFRVLNLEHVAASNWPHFDARTQALADAYLAGVNGWIAHLVPGTLPIEFALLGVRPAPLTREDLVIWSKVMALGLSTNWSDELLRARIVGRLGDDAAAMLMPAYTTGGPVIVPEGLSPTGIARKSASARAAPPIVSDRTLAALMRAVPHLGSGIAASNNWVLNGMRTATSKPILANDPHLGTRIPSVWYLAHVSGGTLDAIGATLPGLPGITIGHNQRVAWGVTNVMTDVQDLFVERVNARQEALYRGQWEPMQVRRESIKVKGVPDELLVVRTTRHGPLVSDILPGSTEALALRWTSLDPADLTLQAFLAANFATTWEAFTAALSLLHAPMQNFVYADIDGNIGYFAPGAIPIRPRADGTLPVPGWAGEDDWTGYVPLDHLPRAFNPARGFVVTANNPPLPDGYPYVISTNYEPGYRGARITAMIEELSRPTVEDVARMQADVLSAQAIVLRPWLLRGESHGERAADAKARLARWDGAVRVDSADSALFEVWKGAAARRIFADELGRDLWQEYDQAPSWKAKALHALAGLDESPWCDDVTTERQETCAAVLGLALEDALRDGAALFGSGDAASWRWGAGNTVTFPHLPFEFSALLRPLFSRRVSVGGDDVTVNPVMRLRDETIVASYRQVIDLSDLDASRFNNTVGQSGQLVGGHYDDLLDKWRKVEHVPMRFSKAAVDRSVKTRLTIVPK
jgi:penicillin amidase